MRSGLFAVMAVWLGACAPATGLQFEIDATGDLTATEVVVYLGTGDGETASIAAESRIPSKLHDGEFWPIGLDPESFALTSSDRTATISFTPGGDSSVVTIVAVGLTEGTPSSVATQTVLRIPTDLVEVWTLTLEPTRSDLDTTAGRAVQRWGENSGDHTCVQAIDRGAVDPGHRNIFIGTPGDRDCDGYPRLLDDQKRNPAECDDDWHDATVTPSIDRLSCMEEDRSVSTAQACIVGGPQCIDGQSLTNTACSHARPFCAPAALCERCAGTTPEDRFRCALEDDPDQAGGLPTVPHMRCLVQVNAGEPGRKLCSTRFHVTSPWPMIPITCGGVPRYHSSDHDADWASTATVGGLSVAFVLAANQGCGLTITPTELAGQSIASNGSTEHGLVAIDGLANRGVIVPIVFAFEDTGMCGLTDRQCEPVGTLPATDDFTTCVRP